MKTAIISKKKGRKSSADFTDSWNSFQKSVSPQNIPTGIFLEQYSVGLTRRFNGTSRSDTLSQMDWEEVYFQIHKSALEGYRPTPPDEVLLRADTFEQGIPIAVLNFNANKLITKTSTVIAKALRQQKKFEIPSITKVLEECRVFAACAIIPREFNTFFRVKPRYRGMSPTFCIDGSFYFTNSDGEPVSYKIDFDDGHGSRVVSPGDNITIEYGEEGKKIIEVICEFPDGLLKSNFEFDITAESAPIPDEEWDIEATIEYEGAKGKGKASIFYAQDGSGLEKPILFADGFPGHSLDFLYGRLKEFNTWEDLNKDHALVILTYEDGKTFVQRNAFVVVECINKLREQTSLPLIVTGVSMGGLITRYALGYMNQNGIESQTETMLCFDSPHKGACIPLGVQTAASFLSSESSSAKDSWNLIISDAAKQMLVYQTGSWEDEDEEPLVTEIFTDFMSDLEAQGWPPIKLLAVSNGIGDGSSNGIAPEDHTLDWYGNICAYGDTWSASTSDEEVDYASLYVIKVSAWDWDFWSKDALAYDGAPGGTRNSNGELAKGIEDSGYGWVDHWHDDSCFVPTVSALALNEDLYVDVNSLPSGTGPFTSFICSSSNTEHAILTQELADWIKAEIASTKEEAS